MSDSAPELVARASVLIDFLRAPEAIELLHRAVASAPDDVEAWCELGRAELACDHPRQALEAVNHAFAHDPSNEWPHRVASIALSRLGDHDAAVRAARESVRLAPHTWQTHRRLAEAIDDYPNPPAGGRLLRDEAWAAASRAVALAPHEPATHCTIGHLYVRQNWTAQAITAFREALRLEPDNATALNGLGMANMQSGRTVAAAADFGAASAANPHDGAARLNLDAAAWNTARMMSWGTLAVILVFPRLSHAPAVVGRIAAAILLIAYCVGAVVFWRRVPRRLHGYLLRLLRRDRWLGGTLALDVATVLLMVAASLPADPDKRAGLIALGWVACFASVIVHWVGISRHNRRLASRRGA